MRAAKEFPKELLRRKVRSSLALRGLTQRDLTAQLRISGATLSRIVRGVRRAKVTECEKIKQLLGYSVARLFQQARTHHRRKE